MKWSVVNFTALCSTIVIAMLLFLPYLSNIHLNRLDNRMDLSLQLPDPGKYINSNISDAVPRCSTRERIALLRSQCNVIRSPDVLLDLPTSQQSKVYESLFVDLNHKLVACLPSKTGCTTWKAILANNSNNDPLPVDFNTKRVHTNWLDSRNIIKFSHLNATMQQHYLTSKNYLKILVTRHPFDRLYSAYVNKFLAPVAPAVTLTHGAQILRLFHPKMDPAAQKLGEGVSFQEFVQYLELPASFNLHWEPVSDLCQPCLIPYDDILKAETYPGDIDKIIRDYLHPFHRGAGTRHNVGAGGDSKTSLTYPGRLIDAYSSLAPWQLGWLGDRFQQDMALFGYSWRHRDDGFYTACIDGSQEDRRCC